MFEVQVIRTVVHVIKTQPKSRNIKTYLIYSSTQSKHWKCTCANIRLTAVLFISWTVTLTERMQLLQKIILFPVKSEWSFLTIALCYLNFQKSNAQHKYQVWIENCNISIQKHDWLCFDFQVKSAYILLENLKLMLKI